MSIFKEIGKILYGVKHLILKYKAYKESKSKILKSDKEFEMLNNSQNYDVYDFEDYDEIEESNKKKSKKHSFRNPFSKNKNKIFEKNETYDKFYNMAMEQKNFKEEINSCDLDSVDILDYITLYLSDLDISEGALRNLQNNISQLIEDENKEQEFRQKLKEIRNITGEEKYDILYEIIDEINDAYDNQDEIIEPTMVEEQKGEQSRSEKITELKNMVFDYLDDVSLDSDASMKLYENIVKIVELEKDEELKNFIASNLDIATDERYNAIIDKMDNIIRNNLSKDDLSAILNDLNKSGESFNESMKSCDEEIEKAKANLESIDIFDGMDEEIEKAKANLESIDIFDGMDEEIEKAKVNLKLKDIDDEQEDVNNVDRKSKIDDNDISDSNIIEINPTPVNFIFKDNAKKDEINSDVSSNVIEVDSIPVTDEIKTDRNPKSNDNEIKVKITYVSKKNPLPYVALSGMNINKLNEILNKNILNEYELISLKGELVNLKNRYNYVTSEFIAENYKLIIDAMEEKLGLSDKKTVVLNYVSLNGINMDKLIELLNKDKLNEYELISLKSELINLKNRYANVDSEDIGDEYKVAIDAIENKLTM